MAGSRRAAATAAALSTGTYYAYLGRPARYRRVRRRRTCLEGEARQCTERTRKKKKKKEKMAKESSVRAVYNSTCMCTNNHMFTNTVRTTVVAQQRCNAPEHANRVYGTRNIQMQNAIHRCLGSARAQFSSILQDQLAAQAQHLQTFDVDCSHLSHLSAIPHHISLIFSCLDTHARCV